jgi:hypothetical protein
VVKPRHAAKIPDAVHFGFVAKSHAEVNAPQAARELLAWTQEDLAEASGVSIGAIRRLEATGGFLK